jgi:pentafunctional AROM polypeptide
VEGVEVDMSLGAATSAAHPMVLSTDLPSSKVAFASILMIGLRGSGKTYNGRLASKALGWRFIDADKVFEEKHGDLGGFVRAKGWDAFRAAEHRILEDLLSARSLNHIISLGGGVVETPACRETLCEYGKRGGPVVYVERDIEEIVEYLAIETQQRPVYGEPVRDVCNRRMPWFEECSNFRLVSVSLF